MSTKCTIWYHDENPYIHLFWDMHDGKVHLHFKENEDSSWTYLDVPQEMLDAIVKHESLVRR